MNRPNIAYYFPADTSIKDLHQKLCLAPELYRYICALDAYIDDLESEKSKMILNAFEYPKPKDNYTIDL